MQRERSASVVRTVFAAGWLSATAVLAALLVPRLEVKTLRKPEACAKIFPLKAVFIELNGGFARLTGHRLCNRVFRDKRGMLLTGAARRDVSEEAAAAIRFSEWLAGRGARYLYVQAPAKADRGGAMHPSFMSHGGNAMADEFVSRLRQSGVETLDLRETLALTPDDVCRQFYRTDHHWNNDAVFTAFGLVAGRLAEMAGADSSAVGKLTGAASWKREVWPNCFLGSRGRRTGRLFSGVDDLIVYTPRFKSQLLLDIPDKDIHRVGSFRQTNMWNADAIQRAGCPSKIAYSALYVGGYYPLVRHQNGNAPIRDKVMVIGDSYARPLAAFLSTVVSDLTVIDPRRLERSEKAVDIIRRLRPEVVLQLINTGGFHSDFIGRKKCGRSVMFDYGLSSSGKK